MIALGKKILGLILLVVIYGCSGVPQVIKNSSKELVTAHEKYGKENEKFLETVKSSLGDYIDVQLAELNKKKAAALLQTKEDKIDDFMQDLRKKHNLAKDAPVSVTQNELKELTGLIEERQKSKATIFDEGIAKLEGRKKTIIDVIELLKSYQQEIQRTVVALDSYLQVEKADEVAWNGMKEILMGKNANIDKIFEKIDQLRDGK